MTKTPTMIVTLVLMCMVGMAIGQKDSSSLGAAADASAPAGPDVTVQQSESTPEDRIWHLGVQRASQR